MTHNHFHKYQADLHIHYPNHLERTQLDIYAAYELHARMIASLIGTIAGLPQVKN